MCWIWYFVATLFDSGCGAAFLYLYGAVTWQFVALTLCHNILLRIGLWPAHALALQRALSPRARAPQCWRHPMMAPLRAPLLRFSVPCSGLGTFWSPLRPFVHCPFYLLCEPSHMARGARDVSSATMRGALCTLGVYRSGRKRSVSCEARALAAALLPRLARGPSPAVSLLAFCAALLLRLLEPFPCGQWRLGGPCCHHGGCATQAGGFRLLGHSTGSLGRS